MAVSTLEDGSRENHLVPSPDIEPCHYPSMEHCPCDPVAKLMEQGTPDCTVFVPIYVHRTEIQRLRVPDHFPLDDCTPEDAEGQGCPSPKG